MNLTTCNLCCSPTIRVLKDEQYIDGSVETTSVVKCSICNHILWLNSQRYR